MSFELAGFTIEGPHAFYSDLKDEPGIYVIVDDQESHRRIIDVGASERVRSRINFHEREVCWKANCFGTFGIGTHYVPRSTVEQRFAIETAIREDCGPLPCDNPKQPPRA